MLGLAARLVDVCLKISKSTKAACQDSGQCLAREDESMLDVLMTLNRTIEHYLRNYFVSRQETAKSALSGERIYANKNTNKL
jgi:hypothetical protein